jgi:hypothetical protein
VHQSSPTIHKTIQGMVQFVDGNKPDTVDMLLPADEAVRRLDTFVESAEPVSPNKS